MCVAYYHHRTFYIATLFIALNAFFKINIRFNHIIFYDIIRLKNLPQKHYTRKQSHIRNSLYFTRYFTFQYKTTLILIPCIVYTL